MAYGERESQVNPEEVLDGFEIDDLHKDVILEVANILWRSDFLTTATPGENLEINRTEITPDGLRRGSLVLDCCLDEDTEEGEDPDVIYGVYIRYEAPDYGLTRSLFEVALKDIDDPEEPEEKLSFESRYRNTVQAWQVNTYGFEIRGNIESVDVERFYELQESDSTTVWDDRILLSDDAKTEQADQSVLVTTSAIDLRMEFMRRQLTVLDRAKILAALAVLKLVKVVDANAGVVEIGAG